MEGYSAPFSTLTSLSEVYNNIVQHFFLWLYFTMTFTEEKHKENKEKKTNEQIT